LPDADAAGAFFVLAFPAGIGFFFVIALVFDFALRLVIFISAWSDSELLPLTEAYRG
jgi:hypothetical protein